MSQTGFVTCSAGDLFFECRGESPRDALICVHGGPGFTSYYLEPLFDLSDSRMVVCYDQAGCGRSRQTCPRRKLFTVPGFVEELEALRVHLSLERMCLLGHSYGGVIVGEYALRYPERVTGIVFACASIDIPRWIDDAQRLVSGMPLMQRMILREGLRAGNYNSPQFQAALKGYYQKHVYGGAENFECIVRADAESDAETYRMVWGDNEPAVTGLAREYNLSPRLPLLEMPTLFVCGRYDEATPEAHQYFASLVPNGGCHIFEHSAHHPQLTEKDEFLRVVRAFVDAR